MPDEFGEKTEAPTTRRRQEAREEGQVARSQDLTAAIMLFGAMLLLYVFAPMMLSVMKVLVETGLTGGADLAADSTEDVGKVWSTSMRIASRIVAPVALGVLVLGLGASVLQVGFMVTVKPITPSLGKISPLRGLKNLFSLRSGMRAVMSILKVAVVLAVVAWTISEQMTGVIGLLQLNSAAVLAAASMLVFELALRITAVLLILAIFDYIYQRWQQEKDLRMSKQEVKEEFKRMEGDPLVKQRRAKVARQLAMQRIQMAVPGADVIVTNPTHFAVALKYDGDSMVAPKVVAKGADFLAARIRQLAIAHNVPIVERPPLARALYQTVEVGQEIPDQFYGAVAEVLAYVYRLSERKIA